MRILLTGYGLLSKQHGGGEVYIRNLAAGLLTNHHQLTYVSAIPGNVSELKLTRISTGRLEEFQLVFPMQFSLEVRDEAFIKAIAAMLKKIGPEMIHAHGFKREIALAAREAGIPCVITVHHGGFVCSAGALLNAEDEICAIPASDEDCLKCCTMSVPGGKFWYPLLKRIPLAYRLRIGERMRKLPFLPLLTPLAQISSSIREKRTAVFDMSEAATRIIAPSPAIEDALIRNSVPEHKITMLPHGIPPMPKFPLLAHDGRVRFVFIGRINYIKGLHVLLEACRWISPESYELHVVGQGTTRREQRYQGRLQRKYRSLNVTWYGGMPSHEVVGILRQCDVMVHPAICLEVFGLSIAEALSVGRPVIATRCGGPEIQIRHNENGFLIPPNDPTALCLAMQRMIDDRGLLADMAQRAGHIRSIESHVREIEKIYLECVP